MGIGDPACDYAVAWTFFGCRIRVCFLQGLDPGAIDTARGLARWKGLTDCRSPELGAADGAAHTLDETLE